ncbi:hypothetical protein D7X87_05890 [bacterium D16-54]|nr:hypothetical protein D7X87_05890 [bacterium D16-54]RKJ15934.1 hypothetical protein D7X65_05885 [bacterium D16-56]
MTQDYRKYQEDGFTFTYIEGDFLMKYFKRYNIHHKKYFQRMKNGKAITKEVLVFILILY